jgi:hypothetical protein
MSDHPVKLGGRCRTPVDRRDAGQRRTGSARIAGR